MPDRKPNHFARAFAVLGLITAVLVVAFTIATWGGTDDDGDGGDDITEQSGPSKKGERALDAGVWVVGEGDTLVSISEATGIDLDELVELNPAIDPQALSPGQRIVLTEEALEGNDSESSGDGGITNDDVPTEGSGIGDEGPTGTDTTDTSDTSGTSDSFSTR